MIHSSPSPRTHFSGWTTLAGVMLAYGAICGNVTYAFGVFLPSMSQSFGWSRSVLSGPYTLFLIMGGMLGPLAGVTLARFGARKNIVLGNVIVVLGLLGMSQVREIWQVYLFFGFMGGLGLAFAEFLSATTVINHWFIRKRSLALGFLFASGGIGGFLLPPFISLLISGLDWRFAWATLAFLHLILGVVGAGLLIRNMPEEEGQFPDGHASKEQFEQWREAATGHVYHTREDWSVRDALRTPALWILLVLFSVLLFATTMLTTHQVAYLQDLNYSPMVSATALGLMLGMSILGRLLSGILGMRFSGRHLAAVFMACLGFGILSLMNAREIVFVYLYSILTGLGFGGMIVLLPHTMGAYFGRANFSRIVGWTTPIVTTASAASPLLTGFLYDSTGSYDWPFALTTALIFVCCILALAARPPKLRTTAAGHRT
ncbi:MAG TPA: MFS transporter [Smithellaceae bacterium]|nr:MFS transporter [Smithellaceae bacterium]